MSSLCECIAGKNEVCPTTCSYAGDTIALVWVFFFFYMLQLVGFGIVLA